MPPYDETHMDFMRDLLAGRKKVSFTMGIHYLCQFLQCSEVMPVQVPRFKELSVTNLHTEALQEAALRRFLPEIHNPNKQQYLFNVSDCCSTNTHR